jgi:glycosyltransferase involved in cell wall biosynthesis
VKILHVIDGLPLGGTENQLLALAPELARHHEIVLVTLKDTDRADLGPLPVVRRYRLGFTTYRSLPLAVARLRKIIADERPDLVRAYLFWASVTARLATPATIPLIFSIHSTMSADGYVNNRVTLWLEKLSYRARHGLIGVSRHALDDFDRYVGIKGRADVMTNFVNPEFVGHRRPPRPFTSSLRLVAVGNLKPVKNYAYLLDALNELPRDLQVDIYGEGLERPALERQIATTGVKARLMGIRGDMWSVLQDYDLFAMPSLYEGCPNAAIEAMAVGLPLLLSDIPVMREVSHGNALFFDPRDPRSFADVMRRIRNREVDLQAMADRGVEIVRTNYLKADYLKRLNAIYADAVASRGKAADGARR